MAQTLSGAHNVRRTGRRRIRNKTIKSALRTQVKQVLAALGKKDKAASQSELASAYSLLDRAARKGIIHANSAARHKARLASKVAAIK